MIPGTCNPPLLLDCYKGTLVLLMHFDGTDGSTTFTDATGRHSFSIIAGSPTISTTQSKFGGASLKCDSGRISGITTADGADWDLAANDFTIEGFARLGATTGSWIILTHGSGVGVLQDFRIGGSDDADLEFFASSNGSTYDVQGILGTLPMNTWAHFAVCRKGNSLRGFVDGVVGFTDDVTGKTLVSVSDGVSIGRDSGVGSVNGFQGWIDEVRIVKGFGYYTTNFTPPTAPFLPA